MFIKEETETAIETVSEDDAGNTPKSVAEATEDSPMAGATILEPIDPDGVTCEEESVESVYVDEWEIARDGDHVASDEVLTFDNDTADKLESYEKTCAIVNDDDEEPRLSSVMEVPPNSRRSFICSIVANCLNRARRD